LSEPFSSRTLVASAFVLAGIAVVRSAIGHASGKRSAQHDRRLVGKIDRVGWQRQ
jgi:hypothetical protein